MTFKAELSGCLTSRPFGSMLALESPFFGEWKMARYLGKKLWLYVVTDVGASALRLHRIQKPAARYRTDEDVFATGFIILEERWRSKNT